MAAPDLPRRSGLLRGWSPRLPSAPGFLAALAGAAVATAVAIEPASAHYTLVNAVFDAGGGASGSAHYHLLSSSGGPGGAVGSATSGGYTAQLGASPLLNEPPLPAGDTVSTRDPRYAKVRVLALLANDVDPEASALSLRDYDTVTAAGGRVTWDQGWLLYEAPASLPDTDSFVYAVQDSAGNPAQARVTILAASPGPTPSANLLAITLLPDGHRRLSFLGIAGRTYALEWAASLPATEWHLLATVEADARGLLEWVDSTEPPPAGRFYRTVAR